MHTFILVMFTLFCVGVVASLIVLAIGVETSRYKRTVTVLQLIQYVGLALWAANLLWGAP